MGLSLRIALRYLFAKKSHNIINIISLISAIGIAIGSMALIIILSGYNGFDSLIKTVYSSYEADFVVTPLNGKKIADVGNIVSRLNGFGNVTPVVEENVFVVYGSNQSVAHMRGVELANEQFKMSRNIVEGEFKLYFGDIPQAVVGNALSYSMGIQTRFVDKLEVYFPNKEADIKSNLMDFSMNPMSALNKEEFPVSGILNLEKNFDNNLFYIPLDVARRLAGYKENEASLVEVYLYPDKALKGSGYEGKIREALGGMDVEVMNHYQQNESMYKIMRMEKFVIFLLLFFVVMIISVNIFSSLAMLVIDKTDDIAIMQSMGATTKMIKQIFILQGWLISVIGAACGVAVGLVVCWCQIAFGLVKLPGNFITTVYPLDVQFGDVLLVFFGVVLCGYLIARLPARRIGGGNLVGIMIMAFMVGSCGNVGKGEVAQPQLCNEFPLVQVPAAVLGNRHDAVDFIGRNFWNEFLRHDRIDSLGKEVLADSSLILGVDTAEVSKAAVQYMVSVLPAMEKSFADMSFRYLIKRADNLGCKGDRRLMLKIMQLGEKIFYNPNSQYRNDELYLPLVEEVLESECISEPYKLQYEWQHKMIVLNRIGTKAGNFSFEQLLPNEKLKRSTLYNVDSEYLLVMFNNPGCTACGQIVAALNSNPAIAKTVESGRLRILAMYTDNDFENWKRCREEFPDTWIYAWDYKHMLADNSIYGIRAIPSIYLLDGEKRVIVKDGGLEIIPQIESILIR